MNQSSLKSALHWRCAALLVERLEGDLFENRALPRGRTQVGHGSFVGSLGETSPRCSRTASGSSEAPRHGPATHKPVSGSKIAPCVEQTKYSPAKSKNSPGCQSSSVPSCGQRFTIGAHGAEVADREALLLARLAGECKAHAFGALGERRRFADQPFSFSHRCRSATVEMRAFAGRVASSVLVVRAVARPRSRRRPRWRRAPGRASCRPPSARAAARRR